MTLPIDLIATFERLALQAAAELAMVPVERIEITDEWREQVRVVGALAAQDCARVCAARYMGDDNREDAEARQCAQSIKAHFGVCEDLPVARELKDTIALAAAAQLSGVSEDRVEITDRWRQQVNAVAQAVAKECADVCIARCNGQNARDDAEAKRCAMAIKAYFVLPDEAHAKRLKRVNRKPQ